MAFYSIFRDKITPTVEPRVGHTFKGSLRATSKIKSIWNDFKLELNSQYKKKSLDLCSVAYTFGYYDDVDVEDTLNLILAECSIYVEQESPEASKVVDFTKAKVGDYVFINGDAGKSAAIVTEELYAQLRVLVNFYKELQGVAKSLKGYRGLLIADALYTKVDGHKVLAGINLKIKVVGKLQASKPSAGFLPIAQSLLSVGEKVVKSSIDTIDYNGSSWDVSGAEGRLKSAFSKKTKTFASYDDVTGNDEVYTDSDDLDAVDSKEVKVFAALKARCKTKAQRLAFNKFIKSFAVNSDLIDTLKSFKGDTFLELVEAIKQVTPNDEQRYAPDALTKIYNGKIKGINMILQLLDNGDIFLAIPGSYSWKYDAKKDKVSYTGYDGAKPYKIPAITKKLVESLMA